MKRILLIGIMILTLTAGHGYAQMGGGMMGPGMMRGMRQMMQWMSGHEVEVDLSGPRPPENTQTVTAGRRIYEQRCAVCHGEKGDGRGKRADELYTTPRDFTIGTYKFRSTPSGSLPRDEDIYTTISRGLRGTAMLPWFGLSKEEKWVVTYYLKTFTERFAEEDPDPPVAIPRITVPRAELVEGGRQMYERTKCWACHGRQGRGDGPKAGELKDDWGRSIRPRDFTSEPFKRGASVNDIFLTVATGLNGAPMASYGDGIAAEDILALAAFVKSLAGQRLRYRGGMMGMMSMTLDERAGMMIDHPGMPGGMMGGGMMGPGMMGPGYGPQYGPRYQQPQKSLGEKDARAILENYLQSARNPNLKLGKIEDKGNVFEAEIVTKKEGALVDRIAIDKNTGWLRSVY
jgi:cytochrome c